MIGSTIDRTASAPRPLSHNNRASGARPRRIPAPFQGGCLAAQARCCTEAHTSQRLAAVQQPRLACATKQSMDRSLTAAAGSGSTAAAIDESYALQTFMSHVAESVHAGSDPSLVLLMGALQTAIKQIGSKVARAGIENLYGLAAQKGGPVGSGDTQKKLDVVANDIMKATLSRCSAVAGMASEEDDHAIACQEDGRYIVVFDPLDGSRNIDAAIPTGTIFGVYRRHAGTGLEQDVLQPGKDLVAAGYALYSSATILGVSFGQGCHGFTLDTQLGEFVLTHPNMAVPARGQIYSVNDARYHDWPEGLRRYIDTIRQGKGQNAVQYSARYICSLVGDFHRTLLYGGVAMNPRSHLRLVYEGNPCAFLAEQAGGSGSDGKRRVLDIVPSKLHERLPLFLGSPEDIAELESYGDVQQTGTKTYTV